VAAGVLLAGGCTGSPDDGDAADDDRGRAAPADAGGPEAEEELFPLDEESLPRDHAAAVELGRALLPEPEDFGPGFLAEERTDDPRTRAELGADCAWRQGPLSEGMLASLTRYVVLPAEGDTGPVRMSAVVNVHRDARAAEWDMARSIEDAQRCPEQQLRHDERVTRLITFGQGHGALNNTSTEDTLRESGEFHGPAPGGPYYFGWSRSRIGPVTVAVSVRGAPGWDSEALDAFSKQAEVDMVLGITGLLGADPADDGERTTDE
jgi:hypothetical protein